MKMHKSIFELEIWQRVKYIFRRWPISNIISVSEPTRIMTLILGNSTHLNKSLTKLKITFHETTQEYFLSSKFDNVLSTFFVDDLYQKLSLFQSLRRLWQYYVGPQPIWTSPWQEWISLFMNLQNCTRVFFEIEIWQRVKYFFRRWPISNIISVSEPTRIMTLLLGNSTHLNRSLTKLKITFHETTQEYFLSSKFDNVLSTFFVDDLYQKLSLFQNLRGLWQYYLGPQPIWTSPWQERKSLFMNLQNCTRVFFEIEIWQRVRYFFRRRPISKIISVSEFTRIMTILLRTSTHLNKSLTRMKLTFHENAQEYFWARNLTTC